MKREHDWFISEEGIAALKWKDKHVVHVVSSYHDPCTVEEVERKKWTNHKNQVPTAVRDYNFNMNFVDKFDQMKKT